MSDPSTMMKATIAAEAHSPRRSDATIARLTNSSTLDSKRARPLTARQTMGSPVSDSDARASTAPARWYPAASAIAPVTSSAAAAATVATRRPPMSATPPASANRPITLLLATADPTAFQDKVTRGPA